MQWGTRGVQVVIAMDDSRSMADTGCGGFACEAVVVLAKALARLEVGSLGIVRFGGAAPVQQLHPLDRPFTDADGPRVLSQLRFDQVGIEAWLEQSACSRTARGTCLGR